MARLKGIMSLGQLTSLGNTTPTPSKGVYRLNPTKSIMKAGSAKARKAVTEDVPGFKRNVKGPKLKQPTKAKGK